MADLSSTLHFYDAETDTEYIGVVDPEGVRLSRHSESSEWATIPADTFKQLADMLADVVTNARYLTEVDLTWYINRLQSPPFVGRVALVRIEMTGNVEAKGAYFQGSRRYRVTLYDSVSGITHATETRGAFQAFEANIWEAVKQGV